MENENQIVLQEKTIEPRFFELKCVICGTKTGEITLPESVPADFDISTLTNKDMGVADSRCDDCLITHGDFKEAFEKFAQLGGSFDDFVAAVEETGGNVKEVVETKRAAVDAVIDEKIKDAKKGTKA